MANSRPEQIRTISENGLEALKDLQWEVRDSQARYRDLLDNQTDVILRRDILRRDHSGRLTFVNDAFCRTFDTTHSDIIGSVFVLNVLQGDAPPSFPERGGEHRRHYCQRIETANGPRWFSWQDYALIDENNAVDHDPVCGKRRQFAGKKRIQRRANLSFALKSVYMEGAGFGRLWR